MEMIFIIILYWLLMVRDMEEIWVFDDGRILCRGRYEELFRSCEKYCELFKEQEKGKDGF